MVIYILWDARYSASHCALIHPRCAGLTPPGTRNLEPITSAAPAMKRTMINHIGVGQKQTFERSMIVPVLRMRVCAFVYIVTVCCLEHMLGWLTAYHVVSDVGFPRGSSSPLKSFV